MTKPFLVVHVGILCAIVAVAGYSNPNASTTNIGVVTTLAGTALSLDAPTSVAVDSSGNVYVADAVDAVIRKITPVGIVTTFAGSGQNGYADGVGVAASFSNPNGLAVDSSGNVYVADTVNGKIRKITPDGTVTTLAGRGIPATLNLPVGVAVDSSGNVYVSEYGRQLIRKIAPDGMVTNIAPPKGASLRAVDSSGDVYVADSSNNQIRKITAGGVVSAFAGSGKQGHAGGVGIAASFHGVVDVAVDSSGNLYVADFDNNMIRYLFR